MTCETTTVRSMYPTFRRFAVYYVPEAISQLGTLGNHWLGWSISDGEFVDRLTDPLVPKDIANITKRAQKYGFHGTLKPPMRLKAEFGQTEFLSALRQLAADQRPFTISEMRVKLIGNFLAITPSAPCPLLDQLATNLVIGLDGLRQPPDELEIAKRSSVGLTKQQHLLLKKWGYPYVLEEFRFHLTLSDALDQNRSTAILNAARTIFSAATQSPVRVSDVAAVGESETGMFHLIERVPLGR